MHRGDQEMKVHAALAIASLLLIACAAPATRRAAIAAPAPLASQAGPPDTAPSEADAAVPIRKSNPSWGSRTALVTIVEFSDFQCPYCQSVQPTLSRLRDIYGPDELRIVWKNSPLEFHAQARAAAEAAMGVFALAGIDAFWRFHDLLFRNQSKLGSENWEEWAKQAGPIDLDAFRAGLASHAWASAIDADLTDGRSAGVDGTPSFFINGIPVVGAEELTTFQTIVDAQVVAARAKRAAGTSPALVYAQLASDNRTNAPLPRDDTGDAEDTRTVYQIPVGTSPILGNPNALVTIVEFSDFECPFCRGVEATLKSLRERYGDRLRIIWKNGPLPFHPWAEPAAQAALEVRAERGDAAFWQVHDAIFAHQTDLSEEMLAQLAAATGASPVGVKAAMAKHSHTNSIEDDRDLAEDFEANGTPHFFVNGRRLVGAQPPEKFERMISERADRGGNQAEGPLRSVDQGRQERPASGGQGHLDGVPSGRSCARPVERESDGARVERLPVPVLRPGRTNDKRDDERLRHTDSLRVARPSASDAFRSAAGRAGCPGGAEAARPESFLGAARQDAGQSGAAEKRRPRRIRQGSGPRYG
jgi:protein-disulfide isomerase